MILEKREHVKPYQYDVQGYIDAIFHSFWIHSEYNYTGDIQDYRVNMTESEREVAKRCMLAISQFEVKVKSFWSNLNLYIPCPEIGNVGAVFGSNEIQHLDFYSHLLDLLGLDSEFKEVLKNNVFSERVGNLNSLLSSENFIEKLIYFTLFVENVSLFSQFAILLSINKHKTYLKGMSNGISASFIEEQIHSDFGTFLINTIRKEYPEMITKDIENKIVEMSEKMVLNEKNLIDRIFEKGELDYISKEDIYQYIDYRMYKGMSSIGIASNKTKIPKSLKRIEIQLLTNTDTDFFNKKSVSYSKKNESFNVEDLF